MIYLDIKEFNIFTENEMENSRLLHFLNSKIIINNSLNLICMPMLIKEVAILIMIESILKH
jgi:hypothetical protein